MGHSGKGQRDRRDKIKIKADKWAGKTRRKYIHLYSTVKYMSLMSETLLSSYPNKLFLIMYHFLPIYTVETAQRTRQNKLA